MRILYIDVDALNPAHLGCYGYPRNTSPTIDALAGEGVRFDNCYASDAPCLPSRTAMYAGRFGIQTGVVGHGGTAAEPDRGGPSRGFRDEFTRSGLAAGLREREYYTALISPFAERHSAHWFTAGFNEVHNTGKCGMESVEDVAPVVDRWLQANGGGDNWYLHVNFWDAHTPYRVPDSYGNPFEGDALPSWLEDGAQLDRHMALPGPHTALDVGMYGDQAPRGSRWDLPRIDSKQALRHWIDGYDTAIRYVDDAIAAIVRRLVEAGVYEDTAIVISADHGECQGHLGIYGEHGAADEGTCRIPMIVKWPGGRQGVHDKALHYHLDWAPTLIDLVDAAGGPNVPALWDGESYAASIVGDTPAGGRGFLVLSQCAHVCQRAVRWDRWLYIRTVHDGFHDWPEEMLFDLNNDPLEQKNLAAECPDECRKGAWLLAGWYEEQMHSRAIRSRAGGGNVSDPMWRVIEEGGPFHATLRGAGTPGSPDAFEHYCVRLEETGRDAGARALRDKYADLLRAFGSG